MRGRLVIAILGAVIVCLLVFFFAVKPKRDELSDVREQIETENARTVQLQTELERLQALQANAPELEAELARIRGLVPVRPELPNIIFQIQEAANRAGIDFVDITPALPKQPPEGAALAEIHMNLGAKGGYFAIQDFIRRLYDLDRAFRYDGFTLSFESADFPGLLRLSMTGTARVFYELPDSAGLGATTTIPTTPGAPAATPTPAATP